MKEILSQVDLIREAFHYKSRFEGSTMVFKIDCPVIEEPGFPWLVKDLALLAQTGFKVVIVPGAKEAIDRVLQQQKIASTFNTPTDSGEPVRITDAQAMPFVEMAAFHVATRFMPFLSGSRVDAIIGNFVRARGLGIVNGVDMGHTGAVDKVFTESISKVLNQGAVPILPCIGWSPAGKAYNVPSDEIALAVSSALGANKLFIVSAHNGIHGEIKEFPENIETRDDGSIVRLTPADTEKIISALISSNTGKPKEQFPPPLLRELRLALSACRAGIDRVHLIDGRDEGAVLKELFSNLGVGTMVYTDEYESIKPLHSRDLPDVLRIMEPLMKSGILLRRTAENIQEKREDYAVFEIDGSVHACGALHDWGEGQGEIAAVASDPLYSGMNLGRRVVGYLIEKARKKGMNRVFVLTIATQDWFEALGFREARLDSLPEKKRQVYDQSRKSKVYALEL
jgi:amino-acid N-acetyltransferase